MTTIQDGVKILQEAISTGKLVPAPQSFPPTPNPQPNPVYPNAPNPNLRSPLPGTQVMGPDTQRQWFQQAVPQARISPQPPSANAVANAAAESQALAIQTKTTVVTGGGTPGDGDLSVQINHPKGTFYGDQNFIYDPVNNNIFGNTNGATVTSNVTYSVAFGPGNNIGGLGATDENLFAFGVGNAIASGTSGTNEELFAIGTGNSLATNAGNNSDFFVLGEGNGLGTDGSGTAFDFYVVGVGNHLSNLGSNSVFLATGVGNTLGGSGTNSNFWVAGAGNQLGESSSGDSENLYAIGDGNSLAVSSTGTNGELFAIGSGNALAQSGNNLLYLFAIGVGNTLSHEGTFAFGAGLTSTVDDSMYLGYGATTDAVVNIGVSISTVPELVVAQQAMQVSAATTISLAGNPTLTELTVVGDSAQTAPVGIFNVGNSTYTPAGPFTFMGDGFDAQDIPSVLEINVNDDSTANFLLTNVTAIPGGAVTVMAIGNDGTWNFEGNDTNGNFFGLATSNTGVGTGNISVLAESFMFSLDFATGALYPGIDAAQDLGFSGTRWENLWLSGNALSAAAILTGATPTVAAGQLGLGTSTGFGNGTPITPVTTTTLGTGSGPTTPQTIVGYLEANLAGTAIWIPYVQ